MEINQDSFFNFSFGEGLRPDPELTISEWADKYRILASVSSSEPGPWQTERTPYLKEIMDCLSPSNSCEEVVFMKGAQVGGTEVGNNWLGYNICIAPGPMLIVNPTVETAKRNSKMRIDPAIENCPVLKEKVKDPRTRDSGNTVLMKEFPGGVLVLTGANSAVGLRSMPIRYLFMDEVDGYPDVAGDEGDPVDLAIQRTATFSNRKIFIVSTPTLKGYSRIESAFMEGDQRYYNVPCPYCHKFQVLTWAGVHFEPGKPETAYYECEHCHKAIYDWQKSEMLRQGKWIATQPANNKVVSFHLSSLYSPYGWISWADIVADFMKVHNDPARLQVWTNTKLAQTWEDQSGESIDPAGLMKRREAYGKYLPKEICVLTAGVDVQDNRLEVEIVGWGKYEESWSVDYFVIYGDPSAPQVWEELDNIIHKTYVHSKEIPNLKIMATCIDSGGHYTDTVVNFCSERFKDRVFAIKGSSSGFGVPIFPMRASQSRKTKKPVYIVGVNDAKQTIMQRLKIQQAGPGYCHFPLERDIEWFTQLTGEVVKTRYVKGRPIREWKVRHDGQAVEALDCRVYSFAALRGLIKNYKLDLNGISETLNTYPIRTKDVATSLVGIDIEPQVSKPVVYKKRVRSKGVF